MYAYSFIWIKDVQNPNINVMQLIKYMIKYDDNNYFQRKCSKSVNLYYFIICILGTISNPFRLL